MQIICYLIVITIIDYSQSDFRVSYGMQNVNNKGVIYAANTIQIHNKLLVFLH